MSARTYVRANCLDTFFQVQAWGFPPQAPTDSVRVLSVCSKMSKIEQAEHRAKARLGYVEAPPIFERSSMSACRINFRQCKGTDIKKGHLRFEDARL